MEQRHELRKHTKTDGTYLHSRESWAVFMIWDQTRSEIMYRYVPRFKTEDIELSVHPGD